MRQTSYCKSLSTCCGLSHLQVLARRGSAHAADADLQTPSLPILGVSGSGCSLTSGGGDQGGQWLNGPSPGGRRTLPAAAPLCLGLRRERRRQTQPPAAPEVVGDSEPCAALLGSRKPRFSRGGPSHPTPPPAPSALAKRLSSRGHDPASLLVCCHTPSSRGAQRRQQHHPAAPTTAAAWGLPPHAWPQPR